MRALVIFNPVAGQAESFRRALDAAAHVWRRQGWHVALNPTSAPGDGKRLAQMAAENHYDMVIAAGGDGTINEVVNGLAGSATVLATLPLGTMNVWARELGLPLDPRAAAEAMTAWQPRPIDLGCAGGRYFLLMAGVGFDATITSEVRSEEKRRLGALAYVLLGLRTALYVRGARVQLTIDGIHVRRRALMVVVGNTQLYGGLVRITSRASIDDGLLDVVVLKGNGFLNGLAHTLAILRQRYTTPGLQIEYYRARRVQITARPALPIQIDGDTIGQTPMTFDVDSRALQALLPTTLPDDLMSRPPTLPPAGRGLARLLGGW
jgi:YegS/Rv2252/BmrU family lipid kinase